MSGGLVSASIPNLVNGVSQQPDVLRLPTQAEQQINGFSTVAKGLRKRPATEHIAVLDATPFVSGTYHTIIRDSVETYFAHVSPSGIQVFDSNGTEHTVNAASYAYLGTDNPETAYKLLTINDYTFLVNTETVVLEDSQVAPARPYEALVVVKGGNYGKTFNILIDDVVRATYTTPDGSSATHTANVSSEYIATQLYTGLNGVSAGTSSATLSNITHNLTSVTYGIGDGEYTQQQYTSSTFDFAAGLNPLNTIVYVDGVQSDVTPITGNTYKVNYSPRASTPTLSATSLIDPDMASTFVADVTQLGNVLYITSTEPFRVRVEDGSGGIHMIAIQDAVQRFSDLPAKAVEGVVIKVESTPDSDVGAYWVKYVPRGSSGVWEETIAPGATLGLDASTMPHVLISEADGTFTFAQADWLQRTVGDDELAKPPSFAGRVINEVFFFKNRLGFLSADAVVMSEAGQFFNFYPTTVSALLDSERIDVNISHTQVSYLNHAVANADSLVLMSDKTQFVLTGGDLLSPKTVSSKASTTFDTSVTCRPLALGKDIYFTGKRSSYASIWEYFVDKDSNTHSAVEITAHVQSYIPDDVYLLAAAPNDQTLVALSRTNPDAVWVYRFYWSGQEKLQSSWSKWQFDKEVNHVAFVNSEMYVLLSDAEGTWLEKLSLSLEPAFDASVFNVCLDHKVTLTGGNQVYDSETKRTTLTNPPYGVTGDGWFAVVPPGQTHRAGVAMPVDTTDDVCTVLGNFDGEDLIFGRLYTFEYTFRDVRSRPTGEATDTHPQGCL
jgi:hypothetical protein